MPSYSGPHTVKEYGYLRLRSPDLGNTVALCLDVLTVVHFKFYEQDYVKCFKAIMRSI